MTVRKMINAYIKEIKAKGGELPALGDRAEGMQIARLQDVWRRLHS